MRLGFALIAAVDTGIAESIKPHEGGAVNFLALGKQTISTLQLCLLRGDGTNKTRYVFCLYYFVKLLVIILW